MWRLTYRGAMSREMRELYLPTWRAAMQELAAKYDKGVKPAR
jgi:hypothetical protein